jgi:long-subunit acyl-CoA synthetase (AMP-forming)
VVVGEGREYLGAVFILNVNMMKRIAKKRNSTPKKVFASCDLDNQLRRHVDAVNRALKVEVKRFSIVPRGLSVKKGNLTLGMSVRRETFSAHYDKEIEMVYKDTRREQSSSDDLIEDEPEPRKLDKEGRDELDASGTGGLTVWFL